jgi:hypothetical protein
MVNKERESSIYPTFLYERYLCGYGLEMVGPPSRSSCAESLAPNVAILKRCGIFLLLFWVGVHCSTCKSCYNISSLNSLLHNSPLSSLLHSWNSFNRSHFSIYRLMYTVFAPYSPSITLSSHPSSSHWYQSPR